MSARYANNFKTSTGFLAFFDLAVTESFYANCNQTGFRRNCLRRPPQ